MKSENKKNNNNPKKWGPYLSERQWGTVREDYSSDGEAWEYFPFDHSHIRAYRWGEDGIGGISDDKQRLCFAPAFWNGKDKIIKERLYGLTNKQGNHGEDVKEYYYYLDSTPDHSYMKMLYKYPNKNYPYMRLLLENNTGKKDIPEFELIDTGIFDDDSYFDIFIEYAKNNDEDILIKFTVFNRSKNSAFLHIIPQIWFRNTWAWGKENYMPVIKKGGLNHLRIAHKELGSYYLYFENFPETLFCNNDSNLEKLYDVKSDLRFFKDGINNYIVNGQKDTVDISGSGTKAGLNYKLDVLPDKPVTLKFRLVNKKNENPFDNFDSIFEKRIKEADKFYSKIQSDINDEEIKNIQRQAFAGMLWNKQFYYYDIREWLNGDPAQPSPPVERKSGRNYDWFHLNNSDIISMPDKWEYPWYATWDSAFHTIPLSLIDPEFAKEQLLLFIKDWYMHPNGQLPAYEWNFSDVNPPVHAWAAWRVFKIDQKHTGKSDYAFLEKIFS